MHGFYEAQDGKEEEMRDLEEAAGMFVTTGGVQARAEGETQARAAHRARFQEPGRRGPAPCIAQP
jgi:hypothetical protein